MNFSFRHYFAKRVALAVFSAFCAAHAARAAVISTNTGLIPNTSIQYTVTLESDESTRLGIRFHFKNNTGRTYYVPRKTFDIPGYLAVFFSTDESPVDSSNAEWLTQASFSGEIPGNFVLEPGKTIDEIFPVGAYYEKIYKKRVVSNVYIYWGLTLPVKNDDTEDSDDGKTRSKQLFPRVGGMLTLPKNAN